MPNGNIFIYHSFRILENIFAIEKVCSLNEFKSGATSNRKSVYIALFLNKLYLYYDVSPLNKVFTTLHRSTQVCVLGSISACKGRYLFGIINISKNFFCIYC